MPTRNRAWSSTTRIRVISSSARRSGPPRRRSGPAVVHGTHVLSSPVAGPVGIARRTTVPPSGRDRTSNRAPISSARSRMNWSPKFRRPRAATAPMSKPRPSSRTSSDPAVVLEPGRDGDVASPPRACGRSAAPPGRRAGRPSAGRRSGRRSGAVRSSRDLEPGQRPHVLDRVGDRAVEAELVEHRRAELADERPDVAELAAEQLAQEAQLGAGEQRVASR